MEGRVRDDSAFYVHVYINTNALNEMLKRALIFISPRFSMTRKSMSFRTCFGISNFLNDNELFAFVLVILGVFVAVFNVASGF